MQTMTSVMREFLKRKNYEIQWEGNSIRATIEGGNGIWTFKVVANEDDRWMVCRSRLPVLVPESLRRKAALFLTHLNDRLILGNFEMDLRDGEVTFKTSVRLSEDDLTPAMVEDLTYANFSTVDRCLPGFLVMVHGDCTLDRALELAKERTASSSNGSPDAPEVPPAPPPDAKERS